MLHSSDSLGQKHPLALYLPFSYYSLGEGMFVDNDILDGGEEASFLRIWPPYSAFEKGLKHPPD
jgi:hypothetical protein